MLQSRDKWERAAKTNIKLASHLHKKGLSISENSGKRQNIERLINTYTIIHIWKNIVSAVHVNILIQNSYRQK